MWLSHPGKKSLIKFIPILDFSKNAFNNAFKFVFALKMQINRKLPLQRSKF